MKQPNVVFITADDHTPSALNCYGPTLVPTPNLDRIADEGMRLDNCFCTNAICTPARATMLTGMYSHTNGIKTLDDTINHSQQWTLANSFHQAGYQTAMIGKWHLGHGGQSNPIDFDEWNVLASNSGQGKYFEPTTLTSRGMQHHSGYVTDVLTDLSLDWLERRDPSQPFLLWLGHKAPHDPFQYHPRHSDILTNVDVPEPCTLHDNLAGRPAAALSTQRVERMLGFDKQHLPESIPDGLNEEQRYSWLYQTFIKSYLRCVAAIDENVGRLLGYLDEHNLSDNTIVIYTSDHGFFLGEHGFYDKRYMYEPSIRIPFLIRYPREIPAGTSSRKMALNVDFAPTLLDLAHLEIPNEVQGQSLRSIVSGDNPLTWRKSMYYRYWMHGAHFNVPAHYGIRTENHKLIYYYGDPLNATGATGDQTNPTWELFDLKRDPEELQNLYSDPTYAHLREQLRTELRHLQVEVGDEPYPQQTP